MAVPDPPFLTPRIMKVLEPSTGQYEVVVQMNPSLASKFPDKPFGTAISAIGLAVKDSDKYPGYTLVSIEPADKGGKDHLWVFQKLDGPEWTTTSNSKESLTPAKFKGQTVVVKTEREVDPDTQPTALTGDLVSSVVTQTQNTGKAVLIDITETITENVIPLAGEEYGDIVTKSVSETLVPDGTPADSGFNVISSVVEPIGNGKSVKQTKTAKGGWSDPVENESSKEVPDLVPAKHRKSVTRGKKTRKVSDIPDAITLGSGETARTYKRETPDRVEETVVTEVLDNNGSPLVGKTITRDGQVGEVIEQLVPDGSGLESSATVVDGSVEALGNGMSVKRTVTVPSVFPNQEFSATRDESIPAKFKVGSVTTTTSESSAGQPSAPGGLGGSVIARSESAVSAHVKRVSTTVREGGETTLTGSQLVSAYGGGVATVTETLGSGGMATGGFGVISSEVTPLGGGKTVTQTVTMEIGGPMSGQNYNQELDLDLPFTESYVGVGASPPKSDVTPVDQWRSKVRTYDLIAIQAKLAAIHITYPSEEMIQLPDVLTRVSVLASRVLSNGDARSWGDSWSYTFDSSVAVAADLSYDITEGYRGPAAAEVHVFFMPQGGGGDSIASMVGAEPWPQYNPQSTRVVISGRGLSKKRSASGSASGGSEAQSGDVQAFTNVAVIPATIHGGLSVDVVYSDSSVSTPLGAEMDMRFRSRIRGALYRRNQKQPAASMKTPEQLEADVHSVEMATDSYSVQLSDAQIEVEPASLPASGVSSIVGGRYLKSSSASFYGYGMMKVTAVVVIVSG